MRLRSTLTTLAVTGALVGGGAAIANAASGTTGSSGSTGSSGTHTTTPTPTPPAKGSTPTPPAKGSAPRGGHNCPNMGAGKGPRSGSSSSGSSFTPGYAPAPNV
jgi:hypothetical protein